jgi:transcriptional regulator with XRE-family HTH domain
MTAEVEVKPLREWRELRYMTLAELARASGLAVRTVFDLEHGNRPARPSTVRRIAAALSIEPRQIAEARPDAKQSEAVA